MSKFEIGDILYIDCHPTNAFVEIINVDHGEFTTTFKYSIIKNLNYFESDRKAFQKNSAMYKKAKKVGKLGLLLYG